LSICCSIDLTKVQASSVTRSGIWSSPRSHNRRATFSRAIEQLGSMIGSRGNVLPFTLEYVRLRAELASGVTIHGETEIVRDPSPVRRLSLDPSPRPMPETLAALVNAHGIVIRPGSLYTSVLPTLLVEGVAPTIHGSTRCGSTLPI